MSAVADERTTSSQPSKTGYSLSEQLGNIPKGWSLRRAKYSFSEIDFRSETGTEELLSVSHMTGVTPRSEKNVTMFEAESYEGSKLCWPNDLVINTLWGWMGALGISTHHGIVSPAYGVYRLHNQDDFNPQYLDYLLRTSLYTSEYFCRSTGIRSSRLRIYPEDFLRIPLLQPPRGEQDAIVAFLDRKLEQIDRFIANKRRLIELLEERKKGVASEIVFGRRNRSDRKAVPALEGDVTIPTSWEVLRAKFVLREVDVRSVDGNETHLSMVQGRGLIPADQVDTWRMHSESYAGGKVCKAGDLVLNRLKAHLSVFYPANQTGVISPDYTVFRMLNGNVTQFFELLFKTREYNDWFRRSVRGITEGLWRLYTPDFYDLTCVVPPPETQHRLVNEFEAAKAELDTTQQRIEREITLMNEFRTSLIAEAVTGKIDLRP